jgi:hypothetical protein
MVQGVNALSGTKLFAYNMLTLMNKDVNNKYRNDGSAAARAARHFPAHSGSESN